MPRGERIARPAAWATHAAGRRGLETVALGGRAALPSRAPLGRGAAIRAAPALDRDLDRFASPIADHAAAEIGSPVPGAPPQLVLRASFGGHVWCPPATRCIPKATRHQRGHQATPLFHLEMVVCKTCRQHAHPNACRGNRNQCCGDATCSRSRGPGSNRLGHKIADQDSSSRGRE